MRHGPTQVTSSPWFVISEQQMDHIPHHDVPLWRHKKVTITSNATVVLHVYFILSRVLLYIIHLKLPNHNSVRDFLTWQSSCQTAGQLASVECKTSRRCENSWTVYQIVLLFLGLFPTPLPYIYHKLSQHSSVWQTTTPSLLHAA